MKFDDENVSDIKDWVANYINDRCIYRVSANDPPLNGKVLGSLYDWQFYLRRGLMDSNFLNAIGILFWKQFADLYKENPFQVAGLETGSTPMLTAIAMTAGMFDIKVNAFSIREKRKSYGLYNRFEGIIDYDLPVLIVDDLCNSKKSLYEAKKACENEGLKVYGQGFVIVNKDLNKTNPDTDKYIGDDIKIVSLFNLDNFILDWKEYNVFCKTFKRNKIEFNRERYMGD